MKKRGGLNRPAFHKCNNYCLNFVILLEVGDIFFDDIQQLAATDYLLYLQNIGPDLPVDLKEVHLLSDVLENGLVDGGDALAVGVQAAADVDGLAGGK